MLRSTTELTGYDINVRDGRIGEVEDFYFDDRDWFIRYLVGDTGTFLPGREVLVSPVAIRNVDREDRCVDLDLTRDQVVNSPGIYKDEPVSRKKEHELVQFFDWPIYWGMQAARSGQTLTEPDEAPASAVSPGDPASESGPALRSVHEVTGYRVAASDGEVGHVD